jgi:hypothetical protein
MADVKISGLPASTVPLAGTEVLPIVQGGVTKQVSVNNLTAGKAIAGLDLTLTSTDAGASYGPTIDLYRDSASPAASDTIGEVEFNGRDSAANKQAYALFHGSISSPTSGAEAGQLHFETATAGALTEKMIIGTSNLVINEPGNIFNVRIEGDTDANLFYTDATNSRVGIGTITPATKLDVNGTANATTFGTSAVAANTTLTGATLAAGGSNTNVSVTVTPKGTGGLALTSGNLVVANGNGIDFSATAGTGTSELFADYEEGTFTPTLIGLTTNPTVTYGLQRGVYTKVGRTVTISVYMTWSAISGGSGSIAVGNFPFAIENTVSAYGGGAVSFFTGFTLAASRTSVGLQPQPASTSATPTCFGSAVTSQYIAVGSVAASGEINFTLTYSV